MGTGEGGEETSTIGLSISLGRNWKAHRYAGSSYGVHHPQTLAMSRSNFR